VHVRRQREGHYIACVSHERGALLARFNIPQCTANRIYSCKVSTLKWMLKICHYGQAKQREAPYILNCSTIRCEWADAQSRCFMLGEGAFNII
jgi:hypothetical protein